jgi:hypothetical protein
VQPADCEDAQTLQLSSGSATANSRKNLFMKGTALGNSTGITKRLQAASPIKAKLLQSGGKALSIDQILEKNNFTRADKKAVYSVKPKVPDAMGMQKKFGGKDVKFHTYIQKLEDRPEYIRVMVVKENVAEILGWKVYESK